LNLNVEKAEARMGLGSYEYSNSGYIGGALWHHFDCGTSGNECASGSGANVRDSDLTDDGRRRM